MRRAPASAAAVPPVFALDDAGEPARVFEGAELLRSTR